MTLLLGIGSLRRSLRLLVLFPLSLVNSLRDCLASYTLPHLRPLALPCLDRPNETALGWRGALISSKRDQRAASDTRHVFLFPSRQV
jgi:hypothetical protein